MENPFNIWIRMVCVISVRLYSSSWKSSINCLYRKFKELKKTVTLTVTA